MEVGRRDKSQPQLGICDTLTVLRLNLRCAAGVAFVLLIDYLISLSLDDAMGRSIQMQLYLAQHAIAAAHY